MDIQTAARLARSYYYQAASEGLLDGYTVDEVAEWTANIVVDFATGVLTSADMEGSI